MMKKSVSTPEGVDRLFDLVKIPDERMKLAFFAALRNTVVANDLDQVSSTSLAENSVLIINARFVIHLFLTFASYIIKLIYFI